MGDIMKKHKYMEIAFKEALKAKKIDEVPVGAIIIDNKGKIIGKGYNKKEKKHNPLNHAEIIAILKATKKKKDWRLNDCTLYTTLEPCEMCESVIKTVRIKNVYYSLKRINETKQMFEYKKEQIVIKKYENIISDFFKKKR